MDIGFPVQTEFIDIRLLQFRTTSVTNYRLMAVILALGIKVVCDFARTAVLADYVDIKNPHKRSSFPVQLRTASVVFVKWWYLFSRPSYLPRRCRTE